MLDTDITTHVMMAVGLAIAGCLVDAALIRLFRAYREWRKPGRIAAADPDVKWSLLLQKMKTEFESRRQNILRTLPSATFDAESRAKNMLRTLPEFDVLRVWHVDSAFVALYTAFAIARAHWYPQDVYNWHSGKHADGDTLTARHFDFVMKVLLNKKLHYESRPLLRNIIFDSFRCLGCYVFEAYFYTGDLFSAERAQALFEDFVFIAFVSYLVQTFVSRDTWFKNQRVLWALLSIEWNMTFAASFLRMMGHCEKSFDMDMATAVFFGLCEVHFYSGADWIEHAIYSDMEDTARVTMTVENFFFNISSYVGMALAFLFGWVVTIY